MNNTSKHSLTEIVRSLTATQMKLEDASDSVGFSLAMAESLLEEGPVPITPNDELEAFRALAAEVKYYTDRWPKQAGEHLKRLAALCPEGREWTPDI